MSTKKHNASAAVVVEAPVKAHKTRAFVVVGLLILVAIAVIGWLVYRGAQGPASTNSEQAQQHSRVLKDVSNDDKTGNYSSEASKLQAYIDSNPSDQYAATEVIRLAATYQNAGDYANAIKWYQVAVDKYPTSKLAGLHGLALTYERQGNKDQAINYYQQAIAVEKADPTTAYLAQSDETAIRYLQGKIQ